MTRGTRRVIGALLMGLLLVTASHAQAPTTPPAPTVPTLDELEQGWLQIVALSEQLAYSDCQRLETVQKFNATLGDIVKRLEARHPGYTLDRAKGVLVSKGQ
jgi:hypothetical protein